MTRKYCDVCKNEILTEIQCEWKVEGELQHTNSGYPVRFLVKLETCMFNTSNFDYCQLCLNAAIIQGLSKL